MNSRPKTSRVDRFWASVAKGDSCWLWTGHIEQHGYGMLGKIRAHRFSYELHVGEIPTGLFVCHHCDVRNCVNPAHFFLGRALENNRDCRAKGREFKNQGEKNPNAKLSDAQVLEIRNSAESTTKLAIKYGVSRSCAYEIKRGLKRSTIPPRPPEYESADPQRPRSKVTEDDVLRMREQYFWGCSSTSIARTFQVNNATAYNVVVGLLWKGVPNAVSHRAAVP